MDLAHTSRYWTSYRASKTFRLKIHIYEAHLWKETAQQADLSASGAGVWDTIASVYLPDDLGGERHETSRARKTQNPVWDETVVFDDIDFSEHVRIEVRGVRKLGEKPVLASLDFEVHDVMGLGLREDASVFQLVCDPSRVRNGVILLAFDFDPPVPADVLVELEQKAPLCWSDSDRSATREVDDPVYINVAGNFACLLLDDDETQNAPQSWQQKGLPPGEVGVCYSSIKGDIQPNTWPRADRLANPLPPLTFPSRRSEHSQREWRSRRSQHRRQKQKLLGHLPPSMAGSNGGPDELLTTNLTYHHRGRRQLSDGSSSNHHCRSSPLGAINLTQQLARSLGGVGREVGNEGISGSVSSGKSKQLRLPSRLSYSRSPTRRQSTGNGTAAAATPTPASTTAGVEPVDRPNRNPRSRSKPPKVKNAEDSSHSLGKLRRPRSWTGGILKSPTLGTSLARAWHAGAVVNHRARGRWRSDTQESCDGGFGAGAGNRETTVDAAVASLAHDAKQSTSVLFHYDIQSAFDSPTSDSSYQP